MPPPIRTRSRPRFPLLERLLSVAAVALAFAMLFAELWSRWAPGPTSSVLDIPWAMLTFGAIVTQSFWVYNAIPALVGLAAAVTWRLPRTTALLTSCLIAAVVPWGWSSIRPLSPPSTGDLTVFSANVLYSRADLDRLEEQIALVDPDVLVFQEVDAEMVHRLTQRLKDRYPHSVSVPRYDAFGQITFSRHPFVQPPVLQLPEITRASQGLPQIVVTIEVEGRSIEIHNVHTLPPITAGYLARQHRHARAIAEYAPQSDAVILAGDFNSPERGSVVRIVTQAGYRSVHSTQGRGLGASWPDAERRQKITFLGLQTRIDHLLFSSGLRCTDQGVAAGVGSDHKPVWASFEFQSDE